MQESEPRIKVKSVDSWTQAIIDVFKNGEQEAQGAKLPWPATHDGLRFRPGEVTLWLGINGHGKSQLLNQACLGFAAQGEPVCIGSFEMPPLKNVPRMLRQLATTSQPSEGYIRKMMSWLRGKVWIYDHLGAIRPEQLFAVIRYCHQELSLKHFVIDSMMKCVHGEDDMNGQKAFVDQLCRLARECEMHIHLVHHSRKKESERDIPGKFDAKGSGAIIDQVDQLVTVWRNKPKEAAIKKCRDEGSPVPDDIKKKCDAMLICDKNRHGDWEDHAFLWFDPASLQYMSDSRRQPIDFMRNI
ncbi:AAA family ATPase [Allopusillimonas ginsengisoli]|uniref:AAA family ATPase n=1 Tax=Allopusillimonas ginsengisoli TaxID=453575 RepID=UPI001FD71F27|nr:AAA family ATPase [Allopusillimonas ginsengisoli]